MALNFVNRGLLSLAFLYTFGRTLSFLGVDSAKYRGVFLLGVWGVGALLLALFPTDVPATPVSWHGLIHLVVAFLAFVGGALGVLGLSLQFGHDPALRDLKKFALPVAAIAVLFLVLLFGLPFDCLTLRPNRRRHRTGADRFGLGLDAGRLDLLGEGPQAKSSPLKPSACPIRASTQ